MRGPLVMLSALLLTACGSAAAPGAAKTAVTRLQLTGDRERIRWWASQHALELLRRSLLERL